ncbi:PBS lyase [Nitrosopumilus sp. b3]|uniref:HEAT repeat domain-containing protein n=1 Tax=Nitrosopumilus sp. b3 TaxID=2109909 RepID=UPI0015F42BD7|nr:HEAT repeat domain-containing protein [Nitrosopumilus sp. b3]KAF6247418.1 PBS lyase [Nitrosopumilus sp. b3]
MAIQLFDENDIRKLSDEERFNYCEEVLKNNDDESRRWDAVWLAGELAENMNQNDKMRQKVADLMEWVLKNDSNGVVKHEASFQIAARNFREKIPILMEISLNDDSILSKHEAIEALGLMRAFEVEDQIRTLEKDQSRDVRETAGFVLKRFQRLKDCGEYTPSNIL